MNCKSYIPGHYSTRDLNMDRGNSWPVYYDNKLLSGHLHNNCILSSLNLYSEYDKEMLKRTMLEHEAIFRKQVHELHRLYRIQKDLMEKFHKNGSYRLPTWTLKSKTSFCSSETQSQVTEKKWQMYKQPALSSSQSKETTTLTNTNVSPISTLQSCFDMPGNGALENEVKLTLANVSDADGGAHEYDSRGKNSLFGCLADLNEPIEDTSLGGTSYSQRSQQLGLVENHRPNGSLRSTNSWLQISSSKTLDFDESGSLPELEKELSQVCSQFLGEAEKSKFDLSLGSDKEKCSTPCKPIQMNPIKANDILLQDLNKADKQFAQEKGYSSKIPRKSSDDAVLDGKLASLNSNTPLLPAWMKPLGGENQCSAGLQTISSFDKSKTMNKLQFCSDLRSSRIDNGRFSYQNGFNLGFHRDFHFVSQPDVSYSNPNLNLRESLNGITDPKLMETSKMDGECEVLSLELPWLKKKLNWNEFLKGNEGAAEIERPVPSCNVESFPSNPYCCEEKAQRNEGPDCLSGEKIIGLPIFEKIQPNLNFLNERHQQVHGLQHGSVFRDRNHLNQEKRLPCEKGRSLMNHIDLNCEVTFIEEPNLSKMLPESTVCAPSQPSDTLSSSKASSLIDMDAPVILPEENDLQRHGCSHDTLIEEAAKSMITLSIDRFKHEFDDQNCLAAEPPSNILHWFANMALLNMHTKISDFEMDPFEQMTLQLKEMKPEATWCSSREIEKAKDDEKSKSLLLFKKPRRGQARKRRQRRDFQKDTLPGLATLSRKEMVEDLQLIGGLMKASGLHWEMSTGRRNGTPVKVKRRQLPRKTTIPDIKGHNRPQKTMFLFNKKAKNPDFEVGRPGMVGWGRTTRRCRRPRCHLPQNVATALT
ncbi:uncharacterized protein LOC110023399 [Phalaenopsis equestris]|uniref:uncharacterized protein LOC110023399 n=1 Tax=Phalaenopsis equestris TaxID=78828 RepID=UPI0009E4918A|nr:uncharacterized protein LOC110023399 [Phalaenopsis equestris]XP_020578465.1 uncharacterized protein LOC110023399 [Phalaenopsis equestris]